MTDGVFTAYTTMTVSVYPNNDHSPTFQTAQYEVKVKENLQKNVKIAKVQAEDLDLGPYGTVSYAFIGDEANKYFRINEVNGE